MPIGSGLPGYSMTDYGAAAGDLLGQQVTDETEEMKRRRQMLQQMQEAVSPFGATSALGMASGGSSMMRNMMSGLRARRGG